MADVPVCRLEDPTPLCQEQGPVVRDEARIKALVRALGWSVQIGVHAREGLVDPRHCGAFEVLASFCTSDGVVALPGRLSSATAWDMPKVDPDRVKTVHGSSYPSPFDEPCRGRTARALGDAAGLTQFGVKLVTLAPGAWSSQRHWHAREDELAYVLAGELVLVEDAGETVLRAGDCVGWPAGTRNGHHLVNRSDADATFLVVGARDDADRGEYPDIDMAFGPGRYSGGKAGVYRHKDGTPY